MISPVSLSSTDIILRVLLLLEEAPILALAVKVGVAVPPELGDLDGFGLPVKMFQMLEEPEDDEDEEDEDDEDDGDVVDPPASAAEAVAVRGGCGLPERR